MKIVWISPNADGAVTAQALQAQGHTLVSWPSDVGVPVIMRQGLANFAKAADLLVVDGPFPLERTQRSWKPSVASLFIDELRRKHGIKALGPTPTVDLLCGDERYFRKWCGRLKIPYTRTPDGEVWTGGAWYAGNDVIPPGPYLDPWKVVFKSVGFRGYFGLVGVGETVTACDARWNASGIPEGRESAFLASLSA